jgi:hypothetical protein
MDWRQTLLQGAEGKETLVLTSTASVAPLISHLHVILLPE